MWHGLFLEEIGRDDYGQGPLVQRLTAMEAKDR